VEDEQRDRPRDVFHCHHASAIPKMVTTNVTIPMMMVTRTLMMLMIASVDKWLLPVLLLVGVSVCEVLGNEGTTETACSAMASTKVFVNRRRSILDVA
jgi:hypothetical protein